MTFLRKKISSDSDNVYYLNSIELEKINNNKDLGNHFNSTL